MCVAVKRLNTGGKPKGVRKFFSAECVHPVPEQHEQPVHVFTGLSVATHPARFESMLGIRKNVSHCLSVPISQYLHFLMGFFEREEGKTVSQNWTEKQGP